ncbi:MAG: V-type ATP synthase subunit F [Nitrososphaerales archaeon]
MDSSDKTVVIGEDPLTLGMRLAGVSEWYNLEKDEAARKLAELLKREDVGIIIASSSIRKSMDWRLESAVEASSKPIVVFVPGKKGGEEESEMSLKELIRRSIGINLES